MSAIVTGYASVPICALIIIQIYILLSRLRRHNRTYSSTEQTEQPTTLNQSSKQPTTLNQSSDLLDPDVIEHTKSELHEKLNKLNLIPTHPKTCDSSPDTNIWSFSKRKTLRNVNLQVFRAVHDKSIFLFEVRLPYSIKLLSSFYEVLLEDAQSYLGELICLSKNSDFTTWYVKTRVIALINSVYSRIIVYKQKLSEGELIIFAKSINPTSQTKAKDGARHINFKIFSLTALEFGEGSSAYTRIDIAISIQHNYGVLINMFIESSVERSIDRALVTISNLVNEKSTLNHTNSVPENLVVKIPSFYEGITNFRRKMILNMKDHLLTKRSLWMILILVVLYISRRVTRSKR